MLATAVAAVIVVTRYGFIVQDVTEGLIAAAIGLVVATGIRIRERTSSY